MKKIFIYSFNLALGGIERSLIGLLEALEMQDVEVDLFLARQEGELLHEIPSYVHLLPPDKHYMALCVPMRQAFREGHVPGCAARVFAKLAQKWERKRKRPTLSTELFWDHRLVVRPMKRQRKQYDLAISFCVPYDYVLEKVDAKRKIGFIHTDYQRVDIDVPFIHRMFEKMNTIACVSESVRTQFLKSFPETKEKTIVVENILSPTSLCKMAEEDCPEISKDGTLTLLSVGRFCDAKNFDHVPAICKNLLELGVPVRWYLIGYGSWEAKIRDAIAACGMEENVIILGKKSNPYPYMAACDLYVQPSRFEGKAVTVREAQILGKPVVITRFATAESQLQDGVDGVIVPMEDSACAAGIAALLQNPEKMRVLSENCLARDYSNAAEVQKILSE